MSGKSELLLFSDPAPQSVIKSSIFDEVGPTSTINNNPDATYDFHIKGSNTQYLDLNESSIVVNLRVYNVVANLPLNLKAADDVAGCNFFLNALFKRKEETRYILTNLQLIRFSTLESHLETFITVELDMVLGLIE